MAEYILSIANASTCPQTSIPTGSSTNISIPFTATISPEVDMDEIFVSITQLPINVSGGLCWAGNNGSRRLTINSITLKSTDTTYATYDTPFQVSGNHGSGDVREVQLIVRKIALKMIWGDSEWDLRQPLVLNVLNLRSFQRKMVHLLAVAGILLTSKNMIPGTIS